MQTNPRLNIRQVTWSNPVGADLRAAQQAELDARFGTPDHEPGPPPSEADCCRVPGGVRQGLGTAGGLRRPEAAGLHHGRDQAAVRAAVHPRFGRGQLHPRGPRSRGLQQGITRIKAEAGSAQPDGRNFYENSGFDDVPNFGPYVGVEHSYCYAKTIDSHSAAHTAMA